jgi:DNA-binding MarR family transcriptional regulator
VEESPNVPRALYKLMDNGLLVMNRNTVDQCVVHIQITPAGRDLDRKYDEASIPVLKLDLPE